MKITSTYIDIALGEIHFRKRDWSEFFFFDHGHSFIKINCHAGRGFGIGWEIRKGEEIRRETRSINRTPSRHGHRNRDAESAVNITVYITDVAARSHINSLRDTIKRSPFAPSVSRYRGRNARDARTGERRRDPAANVYPREEHSGGRCRQRPVEGIISGGATHLDGDAGHDLQGEWHLERLVVVALVDEAQRLRVRQAETADAPRAQRRRPTLHVFRRRLLSPSPSPPPARPPR